MILNGINRVWLHINDKLNLFFVKNRIDETNVKSFLIPFIWIIWVFGDKIRNDIRIETSYS